MEVVGATVYLRDQMAANIEPGHSSPSLNHKKAFQPFQDGIFHHFDFISKRLIATPSLHVPTTKQVVPSPPRNATLSRTINNYDMGWKLALRAICPATDSEACNNPDGPKLANNVTNDTKMVANDAKWVANLVFKYDANLVLSPRFRQLLIDSSQ
ncbi:hypothetical protein TNCV_3266271 [Trichonephila clavipes]|nr:hypothetical protein TNCV_3266271 [Trichonephila clavipes]